MSKTRLFGHSFLWIFTVSIVVLAILLMTARFLVLVAPTYKADLETLISDEIGRDIHIGDISASIEGFQPQVILTNLALATDTSEEDMLHIGEIRLSFSPLGFLVGRITPNKITLVDTNISIKRFADGHISLVGFTEKTALDEPENDFSWLLENGKIELIDSDITWQDELRQLPGLVLNKVHIVFQNNDDEHILKMRASLTEKGEPFVFLIKVTGDVLVGNDWEAKSYLKAESIDFAKYLKQLKLDMLSVEKGVADVELWSAWTAAKLSKIQGYVRVHEAQIVQDSKAFDLVDLAGQVDWKSTDHGWALQTKNVAFKSTDVAQSDSEFGVEYYHDEAIGLQRIQVSAERLNLDALSHVLQQVSTLDEPTIGLLKDLNVRGFLNKAHLTMKTQGEQLAWGACGELKDFSSKSRENIPEIKTLSVTGCSTQDNGWVELASDEGSVYFPDLFRDPIVVNKLEGLLTWTRDADGWQVHSDHIRLNSPHITTQTRIDMRFPKGDLSPTIDLQTNFGRADGRFTSLYLPVGIMDDGLVNWLDNAFIDGDIKSCGLVLKGQLSDFPYREKKGIFQVLFATEKVFLHYADKWPDVLNASADVEFKNEGMRITGYKGSISGNKIKHVLVEIADLETNDYLSLNGKIEDDIGGLYSFFRQSPIEERVGSLLNHSAVSGSAKIDLDIQIPLKSGLETKVNAEVGLSDGLLASPGLDLNISKIQGIIHYDELGLYGKSLNGVVLGQDIEVDIKAKKNSTVILGKSRLDIAKIANQYPSQFWQYIEGSSEADLEVQFPHSGLTGGEGPTITLKSNLKGVSVNLPLPIGKGKNKALPSKVTVKLGVGSLPVYASYGGLLKTSLNFVEKKSKRLELERADIHVGKTQPYFSSAKSIKFSGEIASLDVEKWKKALKLDQSNTSDSPFVNQFNVNIGHLKLKNLNFDNVHLRGKGENSFWVGDVKSSIASGQYKVPFDLKAGQKISLNLDTLNLPSNEKLNLDDNQSPFSPSDIPDIDIKSKALFLGETKLGALELKLRQKKNGMIIKLLKVTSIRDEFIANGVWEKKDKKNRTALNGSLKSTSLGSLLNDMGVTKKIKGAPIDVYFDLHWPGEPQSFSKNHLSGYANVKSAQGRLLDVEPGIGRIFGLLSLSTLQRRLQLGFCGLC